MDFSKAFDKVPHRRLDYKLDWYGIRGNTREWILDFLSGRSQRVVLEGASSDSEPVVSGVTQGTVLGPVLFLLYIMTSLKYLSEINEEQSGFVKGKGTREQMVNIRIIMEKYKEYNIPLYMCFIDYAKAFDCVNHQLLWQDMHKMGFPVHVIELLEHLYKNQEAAVKTSCGTSEWFSIERGVRQGCIVSPSLFNILYSENMMREATKNTSAGITIGGRKINNLRYADDTTLLCESKEDLMELLTRIQHLSKEKGLLLNTRKTKIMVVDKNRTD